MKNNLLATNRTGAWLTSFGDMLTLLLCFFLTIMTFGPLNTSSKAIAPAAAINTVNGVGTGLANSTAKDLKRELSFDEAAFTGNAENRMHGLAELVNTAVDLSIYRIKSAAVEACYAEPGTQEGQSWHVSMQRALALNSQLIDTQLVSGGVSIRAVGPWCSLLNEAARVVGDRTIAAKLVFELEEI